MRRLQCRAGTFLSFPSFFPFAHPFGTTPALAQIERDGPYIFLLGRINKKKPNEKEESTQGQVGAFVGWVTPLDGVDQGYGHAREVPLVNELQYISEMEEKKIVSL